MRRWEEPQSFSIYCCAAEQTCNVASGKVVRRQLAVLLTTNCCGRFFNTCDIITAIWALWNNLVLEGILFASTDDSKLAESTQCKRVTEIALSNGCEVASNVSCNKHFPSPLFRNFNWDKRPYSRSEIEDVVGYLTTKIFEREERNIMGQTPLLFYAMNNAQPAIIWLETFLSLRANVAAVDNLGRGALHSVLLIETCLFELNKIESGSDEDDNFDNEFGRRVGGVLDLCEGVESDFVGTGQLEVTFDEGELNEPETVYAESNGTANSSPQQGCIIEVNNDEDEDEYSSEDEWPSVDAIRDTRDVLQSQGYTGFLAGYDHDRCRLYPKLHSLLKAGCDPNLRDANNQTPSEYVLGKPAWREWERAITDSGWIYDAETGQCLRQIENEDEMGS